MADTYSDREGRRLRAWLKANVEGLWVSTQAVDLLQRRLRARHRIGVMVVPLLIGSLALIAWICWSLHVRVGAGNGVAVPSLIWSVLAMLAAVAVNGHFRRADQRIASELPRRVSRGEYRSVVVLLGPIRTAYAVILGAQQLLVAVSMWWVHVGVVRWVYLVAVIVIDSCVVADIRREARRPTVALDASSLVIDEKLRSDGAFFGVECLPSIAVMCLFLANEPHPSPAAGVDLVSAMVVVLLSFLVHGLTRGWNWGCPPYEPTKQSPEWFGS